MPRKRRDRDHDHEARVVAWKLSQATTAAQRAKAMKDLQVLLGVKQSEVSKLKAAAEKVGYLKLQCTLPREQKDELEQHYSNYKGLRQKLGQWSPQFRDLHVFESGPRDEHSEKGYEVRQRRFGRKAAARVAELLPDCRCLGVAWGKLLRFVARGLAEMYPQPPRELDPVAFVPVCGLLVDDPNLELSSSSVASRLHRAINGRAGEVISLGAVPARIPPQFFAENKSGRKQRSDKDVILEFIRQAAGYSKVFLGEKPLITRLDALLTGVGGHFQTSSDRWLGETVAVEGISRKELDAIAVGDIAGVLIPRDGLGPREQRRVAAINQHRVGITYEQLRDCAADAAESNRPGVIVVAIGRQKADVVRACVRLGLVNELIVDQHLAHQLGRE